MSARPDNIPCPTCGNPKERRVSRDEFALAAMQGWIASAPTLDGAPLAGNEDDAAKIATTAYLYADAMTAERDRK